MRQIFNLFIHSSYFILFLYAVIFLLLTYPLVLNFSSGIIGPYDSDGPIFLWNAWHFSQAGFSLYTDSIFYPHTSSLALHTYTMFQSMLVFLFDLIFRNTVLSFNLSFLVLNVATAYFAYKFFVLHIKSKIVAFLAGEFFAFQALWSIYAIFGTQNFLGLWYIPASLYLFESYRRKHKNKCSILLGLVVAAAFINGFYSFVFTVAGLAIYIVVLFLFKKNINLAKFFKLLLFSILSFFIFASWKIFYLWQQIDFIKSIPPSSLSDIDRIYHADPMNLLRPVQFHSIWGHWHTWFRDVSIENGNAFVGFTFLLVLALFVIIKLVKKTQLKHRKVLYVFLVAYLLTVLLSLGPYLHFFGIDTHLPMPHYILQKIFPFYSSIRFPARWLILAQIFLAGIFAILLNYVFANLSKKIKIILAIIIGAGIVLDVAYLPREITVVRGPETQVYQEIAGQDDDKSLLYLPMSVSSGYFAVGGSSKRPMAYQLIHRHPIFGGHLSRLPFIYRDEYTDVMSSEDFVEKYNIGYIVIDKSQIDLESEAGKELKLYLINDLNFVEYYQDQYNYALVYSLD